MPLQREASGAFFRGLFSLLPNSVSLPKPLTDVGWTCKAFYLDLKRGISYSENLTPVLKMIFLTQSQVLLQNELALIIFHHSACTRQGYSCCHGKIKGAGKKNLSHSFQIAHTNYSWLTNMNIVSNMLFPRQMYYSTAQSPLLAVASIIMVCRLKSTFTHCFLIFRLTDNNS